MVRPVAAKANGAAFTNIFVKLLTVKKFGDRRLNDKHNIIMGKSNLNKSSFIILIKLDFKDIVELDIFSLSFLI
jgi:hypothetical protein